MSSSQFCHFSITDIIHSVNPRAVVQENEDDGHPAPYTGAERVGLRAFVR